METPLPAGCALRFEAVRVIATGGYGIVYQALQRDLGRQVAIKVLHQLDDPEQVARFREEARVTAQLRHPHVVEILDHGIDESVPWIAYELLAGPPVRGLLRTGPLAWKTAVAITGQVAAALDEAHATGILHRDIKPDNVLEAGPGHYKVADFGIAKWSGASFRTKTGVVLGSPAYLSPEQATGGAASAASDLYALGIMLFELLTGRPPFVDGNVMILLERHARSPMPSVRSVRADVPAALEALVFRLTQKKPTDRPARGRDVVDTLAALAPDILATLAAVRPEPRSKPVPPVPTVLPRLGRAPLGRRIAALVTGAALAAGLLVGVLVTRMAGPRASAHRAPSPATSPPSGRARPSPAPSAVADRVLRGGLGELDGVWHAVWEISEDLAQKEREYAVPWLGFRPQDAARDARVLLDGFEHQHRWLRDIRTRLDASPHSGPLHSVTGSRLAALECYLWHQEQWVNAYIKRAKLAEREGRTLDLRDLDIVNRKLEPGARHLLQRFIHELGAVLAAVVSDPACLTADAARAIFDVRHVFVIVGERKRDKNYTEDMPDDRKMLAAAIRESSGPVAADMRSLVLEILDAALDRGRAPLRSGAFGRMRALLKRIEDGAPQARGGVEQLRRDIAIWEERTQGTMRPSAGR
jgi:serine/threonine-protein kinase